MNTLNYFKTLFLMSILIISVCQQSFARDVITLIKDLNTSSVGSNPYEFTKVGDKYFFGAKNAVTGAELYITDGTETGTCMVKDISPGPSDSGPGYLTDVNGLLFFAAQTDQSGTELWRSDGTEVGTYMIKDIRPGPNESNPSHLIVYENILIFSAENDSNGIELWRSDGTESGTYMIKDIRKGEYGSAPDNMTLFNNFLYFSATDSINGNELWRTDGTYSGTIIIKDILSGGSSYPKDFVVVVNKLFFSANISSERELWATDGTTSGTYLVIDIDDGPFNSANPEPLGVLNDIFVFTVDAPNHKKGIWRTDGTPSGTYSFPIGESRYQWPTVSNNELFFVYADKLYKINSSADEVFLVKEFSPWPAYLVDVNGLLFFYLVHDSGLPLGSSTLGISDGTTAGTDYFGNYNTGLSLVSFNNKLYFTAYDSNWNPYFYSSDGTEAGTKMVKADLDLDSYFDDNSYIIDDNNNCMLLAAYDSNDGLELWKTDGNTAGTQLIKNINTGTRSSSPDHFLKINDLLYFTAYTSNSYNPNTFCRTDGTEAGTEIIKTFDVIDEIINVGGTIYLKVQDINENYESDWKLWKSDGTDANTVLIFDANNNISDLSSVNDTVFFTQREDSGLWLWKTIGTTIGTERVKLLTSDQWGYASYLTECNDILFFRLYDETNGEELWKSDGTDAGTYMVRDISYGSSSSSPYNLTAINGILYFSAQQSSDRELWRSDGTSNGTYRIKNINPTGSSYPSGMTLFNGEIYFVAKDDIHGVEIWKTDGTYEGTERVSNINSLGDSIRPFINMESKLVFCIDVNEFEVELWKSDGLEQGTALVADIFEGQESSNPSRFTEFAGRLFFTATDGIYGRELRSMESFSDGDFDFSRTVDFIDYSIFSKAWLSSIGNNSYNPLCDIDNSVNGAVNNNDLNIFSNCWLDTTE